VTTLSTADLLSAYDSQLREDGELRHASARERHGPVWWATFEDRFGFVTYRGLDGLRGAALNALIGETVAHFRDDTAVADFEWKTRGHDAPADLGARLAVHGLVAGEAETVMVGEAAALAADVPLAPGVVVRRAGDGNELVDDVVATVRMQDAVFGSAGSSAEALLAQLAADGDFTQVWLAEADGGVVSAGRVVVVPGTEFAGIWGGATLPGWRGRGIYRALTAARARAVMSLGVRYLHSDSTEMSRPILERSGLLAVTTTTPYVWTRERG
jgi:hypothetical protein